MRCSIGHLRTLIIENIDDDELRSTYEPAVKAFAAWLRENPSVLETQAGIDALGMHFYWLKPGSVPTDADIKKDITNMLKAAKQVCTTQKDRLELIQRHIDDFDANNVGNTIWRLKKIAGRSRPASASPEGKTWGSYLFAPAREDVPLEKNTPDEQAAYDAIHAMLFKNRALPPKVAQQLQSLVSSGEYVKLLDPPYTDYYRGMNNVSTETLTALLGHAPKKKKGSSRVSTSFKPKNTGSSWTADRSRAQGYADYGAKGIDRSKIGTWSVILHAKKSDNQNKFILNPDVLYDIGDFSGSESQDNSEDLEVYAVGTINLVDVTYSAGTSLEGDDVD